MPDKIYVALSTFAAEDGSPLDLLKRSGVSFDVLSTGKRITTEEILRYALDASVIVAGVEPYTESTLEQLPKLRCISRCGVGVDAIDLKAAAARGITVANTPGIPTQAVVELALGMFLTLSRNLIQQNDLMRARKWERVSAHLLGGRTVGIFGLGKIGRRVAELCRAFGAVVIGCDPVVSTVEGVRMVTREELLRRADIISIHASKVGTGPLIGKDQFSLMKPGTVLVNLARGDMVDEASLIEALQSGKVSGAGLDVFSAEPYSGPLCDFPQVILTPHSATMTFETRIAMETECVQNALDFLAGREFPNRVRI